jgi:hypothetical protein
MAQPAKVTEIVRLSPHRPGVRVVRPSTRLA